jgi:hypothetical protein
METQRLLRRIRNLPMNLERSYLNDISSIIDKILEEYDIFYKDTDEKVKRGILLNKFKLDLLDKTEETIFCSGFSKNGNKCINKTFEDSKYCKKHHYLTFRDQFNDTTIKQDIFVLGSNEENNIDTNNIDTNNLKTKMIDDTFYYTDDQFIYERDTLKKVGYIENEFGTKNYVLTDDPFILSA